MAIVKKDHLVQVGRVKLITELVDVDGGQVRVRGLARTESMALQDVKSNQERELHIVQLGLVEPEMTLDEVRTWAAEGPAGEVQDVALKIGRLSRLMPDSAKEATKSVSRRR